MTNEEKIRLVLETLGVDNVRQATKAIRDMESAAEDLDGEIKSGLIKANGDLLLTLKDGQKITADSAEGFRKLLDQQGKFYVTLSDGQRRLMDADDATREASNALNEYQERVFQASRSVDDLQESHVDLYRAMQQRGTPAMDAHVKAFKQHKEATEQSQQATQAFGRRMLEASYLLDDIQYGFRGIVNNIPQLARAFGVSTAAVGAFGIAAVGVNQAIQLLGPLFENTKEPAKKFGDAIGDFAKNLDAGKYKAEELGKQVKKMAESFSPGLMDAIDTVFFGPTIERMDKIIEKQKQVIELNEKVQQQQNDIKKIEDQVDASKKDQRANLAAEYFQGQDQRGQDAAIKTMMPEFMDQAKKDIVDREMAKLESMGMFDDGILGPSGDVVRAVTRGNLIRNGVDPKKVSERARELSMAAIGAAQRGDKAGIERLARMDPNFAAFVEADAADKQFDGGITDRSKARANRDAIRAKRSIEQANNPQIPDAIRAQRQLEADQIAAGERAGAAMLPNGEMFSEEKNRRILEERTKAEAAEKARRDILAGLADQLPDPETLAAMRRGNAGIGVGAVRRMRALEDQDQMALFGTFRNAGMNEGDAKRSVAEYMQQGNQAFSEFAEANGMNARNLSSGFRASQALLQKIMQDQQETQEIVRWMESMMNMQNQPQATPPNRVRN